MKMKTRQRITTVRKNFNVWFVGKEKLKLEPNSANEFTRGDPQTAENSVIYLPVNDTRDASPGPNKSAWRKHAGKYAGTFIGGKQLG